MRKQNVFQKLVTLVKGGLTKAGETVVDMNAITILEQEIKDGQTNLDKAKQDLTKVMRSSMQCGRKIEELKQSILTHEGYAMKAMEKSNESMALEVAQKIAEFESDLNIQQSAKAQYDGHIVTLKAQIKSTQKAIDNMDRELTMVKTTESVQKASASITQNYATSGSKVLSAKDSLKRIQERQQNREDELIAGEQLREEFEGKSLEDQLRSESIIEDNSGANSVLERLKAKQAGNAE